MRVVGLCNRALDGLAESYAPSLYHPYYLCLGTHCNCAFDPPDADLKNSLSGGIGAAVDALRKYTHIHTKSETTKPVLLSFL